MFSASYAKPSSMVYAMVKDNDGRITSLIDPIGPEIIEQPITHLTEEET